MSDDRCTTQAIQYNHVAIVFDGKKHTPCTATRRRRYKKSWVYGYLKLGLPQ